MGATRSESFATRKLEQRILFMLVEWRDSGNCRQVNDASHLGKGGTVVTTIARSEVDPYSEAFLTDPYPFFHELREAGQVVYLERYGAWGVARHAECAATLLDSKSFCSGRGVGLSDFAKEEPWRPQSIILEADPPLHTRTHRMLLKVLSPVAIQRLREGFQEAATRLVDGLLEKEHIDGIRDIAQEFPLRVFPDAVGIMREGRENLLPYGAMAFNAFGPRNERYEAAMVEYGRVTEWIAACCKRENLAPGGIGDALYCSADAGEITHEEASLLVRSLLAAGLDTTINAIGNALSCLSRFPDEWNKLRRDPSLIRNAIEEVLRFESPVQTFFRTTTCNVTIGGTAIPEGEKVLAFLASANRDPRRWDRPDVFDISRGSVGHLDFGYGIHTCVGQMLAKTEAEILLTKLVERVSSIVPTGEAKLRLNNTLRGFESMPLRLSA